MKDTKYMDVKRPVGRPPMPEEDRRQYQRVAILTSTYERATKNADKLGVALLEYFDKVVK